MNATEKRYTSRLTPFGLRVYSGSTILWSTSPAEMSRLFPALVLVQTSLKNRASLGEP